MAKWGWLGWWARLFGFSRTGNRKGRGRRLPGGIPKQDTLARRLDSAVRGSKERDLLRGAEESLRRGRRAEAIRAYEAALAVFLDRGAGQKAVAVLTTLARLEPDVPKHLESLAEVYEQLGRRHEAEVARRRAAAVLQAGGAHDRAQALLRHDQPAAARPSSGLQVERVHRTAVRAEAPVRGADPISPAELAVRSPGEAALEAHPEADLDPDAEAIDLGALDPDPEPPVAPSRARSPMPETRERHRTPTAEPPPVSGPARSRPGDHPDPPSWARAADHVRGRPHSGSAEIDPDLTADLDRTQALPAVGRPPVDEPPLPTFEPLAPGVPPADTDPSESFDAQTRAIHAAELRADADLTLSPLPADPAEVEIEAAEDDDLELPEPGDQTLYDPGFLDAHHPADLRGPSVRSDDPPTPAEPPRRPGPRGLSIPAASTVLDPRGSAALEASEHRVRRRRPRSGSRRADPNDPT